MLVHPGPRQARCKAKGKERPTAAPMLARWAFCPTFCKRLRRSSTAQCPAKKAERLGEIQVQSKKNCFNPISLNHTPTTEHLNPQLTHDHFSQRRNFLSSSSPFSLPPSDIFPTGGLEAPPRRPRRRHFSVSDRALVQRRLSCLRSHNRPKQQLGLCLFF